jgi:dihydroneopterin aldolase
MDHDTIAIHNLEIVARHGVYDDERTEGRRFAFDVEADLRPRDPAAPDEILATVDYRDLAAAVLRAAQGPSRHLIETLAEQIAADVLADPRVSRVRVRVRKYATGVPGAPEWVGLAIARSRSAAAQPAP